LTDRWCGIASLCRAGARDIGTQTAVVNLLIAFYHSLSASVGVD
jgi:hypothetical protein